VNRRALVFLLLHALAAHAYACRFAQDAQPAQWYEWSSALFSADVASVHADSQKRLDLIDVRVVETFKGPPATSATLQVPSRMWHSCRLERPLAGTRVLVAMNPNNDILLVPLDERYAERLRRHGKP
jgi:hypothetical protein